MVIVHKSWCGACKGKNCVLHLVYCHDAELCPQLLFLFLPQRWSPSSQSPRRSLNLHTTLLWWTWRWGHVTLLSLLSIRSREYCTLRRVCEQCVTVTLTHRDVLMTSCVFVLHQDEEEPKDEAFSPDGGYIPRILFLGTDGLESWKHFLETQHTAGQRLIHWAPTKLLVNVLGNEIR